MAISNTGISKDWDVFFYLMTTNFDEVLKFTNVTKLILEYKVGTKLDSDGKGITIGPDFIV